MAKKKDAQTLDQLKEQRDALALRLEIEGIQRMLMPEGLLEAWGDTVDRTDARWSTPNNSGIDWRTSVEYDRKDGDNPPFWTTEQEHADQRGIARFLATADETVIAAIENIQNYTVGHAGANVGFESDGNESLVKACDRIWRIWCDEHRFDGEFERELVARLSVDGERKLWVPDRPGQLTPGLVVVEPEWVTEPIGVEVLEEHYRLPSCNWKYGVAVSQQWSEKLCGVYAQRYGETGDWEFIPDSQLVFDKRNVVRRVKRGLSDLYAIYKTAEATGKLLGNTMISASIQAAIAYIRHHAAGVTGDQIRSAASGSGSYDFTVKSPTGQTSTRVGRKIQPGAVIDVSNGLSYAAGPVGAGAGVGFLGIVQGGLRRIGARFAMPEYMISGDASNANYASTLVAQSPFVKAMQARQYVEEQSRRRLVWLVLGHAVRAGALRAHGIENLVDLRAAVDVTVAYPEIADRDPQAELAGDQFDLDNGLVSKQTLSLKRGYDYAAEQELGAASRPDQSLVTTPLPTVGSVAADSTIADDLSTVGGEVIKPQDTALNGAQIQAALTIVQSVAGGTLPRDSALGQLITLFNLTRQEAENILGSAGKTFKIDPANVVEAISRVVKESWKDYP